MGNVTNKNITKHSTCLNYYIKPLQTQYGYSLEQLKHYSEFIDKPIDTVISQYKDAYLILFRPNPDQEFDRFQREMLAMFGYQVCGFDIPRKDEQKEPVLDAEYFYNEIKTSPYILFLGFDNGIFCRLASILTMNFDREKTPSGKYVFVGNIATVCAIRPYSKELYNKIKKLKDQKTKLKIKSPHQIDTSIEEHVYKLCKFQLGKILLFKALQFMKKEGVQYVKLECEPNLLPYYMEIFKFRLGPSPYYDYTSKLLSQSGYDYSRLPELVQIQDDLLVKQLGTYGLNTNHLRLASDYVHQLDNQTLYKCFMTYSQLEEILPLLKTHLLKHLQTIIDNAVYDIFDRKMGEHSISRSLVYFDGFEKMSELRNGYDRILKKHG
jgi:hypothetical protein